MTSSQGTNSNAIPTLDEGVDYYQLLNVPYAATSQEIGRAYRVAMKRSHPDRHRPDLRSAAEERAKLLNRAFTTLSRTESRRAYDETIKGAQVQQQIMSHYFGGRPPGETHDRFGDALRRSKTRAEREDERRADRSAFVSILIVFGGATVAVIALLILWSIVSFAIDKVV